MGKKCFAVIVAGGSGTRMGAGMAKQFLELGGKPIIEHTINAFASISFDVEIILVLPEKYRSFWSDYCQSSGMKIPHQVVSGGITRFHSVKNALKYIPDNAVVAIHDGVRPFVDAEFLEYMFGCGIEHGAAIPVIPPSDSMRITYGEAGSEIVDRSIYVMVQTPQVFHSEILKEAYKQAFSPEFTDDASVVETIKQKIYLAEGRFMNIKITRPDDLVLGDGILNAVSSKNRS